jgi:pimeloyl-ACP methyl ester carboxylesterase
MQPTKIIEIGGEGGSITLYGWKSDKGKWHFLSETNERTILDMIQKDDAAGLESQPRSGTVTSWKGALKILSRYPWQNLYPLFVHQEFVDLVWHEIENLGEKCNSRSEWENVCSKKPSRHTVCFSHGKESGPWGRKITALAAVAKAKGFNVVSIDYKGDPDCRAKRLCCEFRPSDGINVLVGTSMGGYVTTVASRHFSPDGLFLLAPAFGMKGYREQLPLPCARKICVVHGLHDEIVPIANSMEFAVKHNAQFHMLDDGHQLIESIPVICDLFARFLDSLLMYKRR